MTKKAMKLIDPSTGLMECKFCGSRHLANVREGVHYFRGAWQCRHGCRDDEPKPMQRTEATVASIFSST